MAAMGQLRDIRPDDGAVRGGRDAAPACVDPPRAAPPSPGRRAALLGILASATLVCGYVELLAPLPVSVPGLKLGLGNAVVLIAIDRMGARAALAIMLTKAIGSALLFGAVPMLPFSLAGGLLSWAAMCAAHRSGLFSTVSVSVLGGIAHNAGQLMAVWALLSLQAAAVTAPVLAVAGVTCGAAVGIIICAVLAAVPKEAFHV